MSYRHITRCIPVGQQQSKWDRMVAHGVPLGALAAVIGAMSAGWVGAAAGIGGIVGLAVVAGFCDWWFHYRLICIRDDQCAVGTVGRTAVSTGVDDPDLDFTINLVLAPVARQSFLDAAAQLPLLAGGGQERYFIGQPGGYPPLNGVNEITTEEEGSTSPRTTALHCEIEGNGMEAACTAATVAGVIGAVAGTAAGIAAGAAVGGAIAASCAAWGPFAWVCLIIALIVAVIVAVVTSTLTSAAITGLGWLIGVAIGGDSGSPADVAADPNSGTIELGDHVAILGDWIFDNAHDGWHELHPVKKVMRLQCPPPGIRVPGVDPEEPNGERSQRAREAFCLTWMNDNARRVCELLVEGQQDDVRHEQQQPGNDPAVHRQLG